MIKRRGAIENRYKELKRMLQKKVNGILFWKKMNVVNVESSSRI